MSEDVELRDLRERILDAARNERNGLLILPMGVFLIGAGLIFNMMWDSSVAYIGGVFVTVLGVFSTIFGFYVTAHYAHKYNNLLKELVQGHPLEKAKKQ